MTKPDISREAVRRFKLVRGGIDHLDMMCVRPDGEFVRHADYAALRDELDRVMTPADDKDATIARLTKEVDRLTTAGICEVAVRNPQVMEYMKHWEGRAEAAEARVAELEAALRKSAAKFEAVSRIERLTEWLQEDPDNIHHLDQQDVATLRRWLDRAALRTDKEGE